MPENRLAREKSPYLLQHAQNPVDWYPWGDEAFARARAEDKPIFLSIGYSTCHWCHVMERESFEDPAIAALMNRHFVNVKVDREERPDVDRVYMTFVQATTGSGGWPMSVFLTPGLEPFFGGTYFPPRDAHGRPGFPTLLRAIADTWAERRDEVRASGAQVMGRLQKLTAPEDGGPVELLDRSVLSDAYRAFAATYDERHGGFGGAPKFPRPSVFFFLFRWFDRAGVTGAAEMAVATLRAMARGGMYDHLGGGFHRYSVDRQWHVPHFEKMLYDQAQLVASYVEAFQLTGDPRLAAVARETCDYVLRDLTDPATGAFLSAEDADSPIAPGAHEKAEGAFYVFTLEEVTEALGDAAPLFCRHYDVRDEGNAQDPHGELRGQNVLHVRQDVAATAKELGLEPAEAEGRLAAARATLLEWRARRPRPHRDDKVIAAWNGLMIGALARAARALDEPRWLAAAERAAEFAATTLFDSAAGRLRRRFRDGEAAIDGYLEDYAFLAAGLVDLYEADFDRRWLALAEQLTVRQNELFWDGDAGGFFETTGQDPTVLLRLKEDYDGAEPSGNSVAALTLFRLAELLGRPEWARQAEVCLRAFSRRLRAIPHALPQMLGALAFTFEPPVEIVIAGERDDPGVATLLSAVSRNFLPFETVRLADAAARRELASRMPWLADMRPVDGRAAAYVCREHACARPVITPEELVRILPVKTLHDSTA